MFALKQTVSFHDNSVYPSLNYKCSLIRVACSDSTMYIYGTRSEMDLRNGNRWQLWKYNFSTKLWSQMEFNRASYCGYYGMALVGSASCPRLIFGVSNELIAYNCKSAAIETIATIPEHRGLREPIFCEHNGRLLISLLRDETHLLLYSFDVHNRNWHKFAVDLPDLLTLRAVIVPIFFDSNLFFFCSRGNYDDWPQKILTCDINLNATSFLQTINEDVLLSCPNNLCEYFVVKHNESAYIVIANSYQMPQQFKKIWRFHFPSLTWSSLPNTIPESKLLSSPCITIDGQMHFFCKDGMYTTNVATSPCLLQNICWDMIVNHPRSHSLITYSEEELLHFGIHKKFVNKLCL